MRCRKILEADADGDGKLTKEEFSQHIKNRHAKKGFHGKKGDHASCGGHGKKGGHWKHSSVEEHVKYKMEKLDTNQDGVITSDETEKHQWFAKKFKGADVDADGKEEVFVGFALIDDDGRVIFAEDARGAHQDACYIVRPADGKWRLLFGNGGIHCLNSDGRQLWHHPLGEAQHVVAGRFRTDSEMQLAVVDRTPIPSHRRDSNAWAILYLYDLDGREIWRRQQEKGAWCIATLRINWFGQDKPHGIFVYGQGAGRPAVIYDGEGPIVDTFPMAYAPDVSPAGRPDSFYAFVADVWGDSRDEAILFNHRGLCIYSNARPTAIPTLYNETLYPGM